MNLKRGNFKKRLASVSLFSFQFVSMCCATASTGCMHASRLDVFVVAPSFEPKTTLSFRAGCPVLDVAVSWSCLMVLLLGKPQDAVVDLQFGVFVLTANPAS